MSWELVNKLYGTTGMCRNGPRGPKFDPCERTAVFLWRLDGDATVRRTAIQFGLSEGTISQATLLVERLVDTHLPTECVRWLSTKGEDEDDGLSAAWGGRDDVLSDGLEDEPEDVWSNGGTGNNKRQRVTSTSSGSNKDEELEVQERESTGHEKKRPRRAAPFSVGTFLEQLEMEQIQRDRREPEWNAKVVQAFASQLLEGRARHARARSHTIELEERKMALKERKQRVDMKKQASEAAKEAFRDGYGLQDDIAKAYHEMVAALDQSSSTG